MRTWDIGSINLSKWKLFERNTRGFLNSLYSVDKNDLIARVKKSCLFLGKWEFFFLNGILQHIRKRILSKLWARWKKYTYLWLWGTNQKKRKEKKLVKLQVPKTAVASCSARHPPTRASAHLCRPRVLEGHTKSLFIPTHTEPLGVFSPQFLCSGVTACLDSLSLTESVFDVQ